MTESHSVTSESSPSQSNVSNKYGISKSLNDALFNTKDRPFVLKLEKSLLDFIDSNINSYKLSPMNSYCRLLAHQIAEYHGLKHILANDGVSVVVFKTFIPPRQLSVTTDDEPHEPSEQVDLDKKYNSIQSEKNAIPTKLADIPLPNASLNKKIMPNYRNQYPRNHGPYSNSHVPYQDYNYSSNGYSPNSSPVHPAKPQMANVTPNSSGSTLSLTNVKLMKRVNSAPQSTNNYAQNNQTEKAADADKENPVADKEKSVAADKEKSADDKIDPKTDSEAVNGNSAETESDASKNPESVIESAPSSVSTSQEVLELENERASKEALYIMTRERIYNEKNDEDEQEFSQNSDLETNQNTENKYEQRRNNYRQDYNNPRYQGNYQQRYYNQNNSRQYYGNYNQSIHGGQYFNGTNGNFQNFMQAQPYLKAALNQYQYPQIQQPFVQGISGGNNYYGGTPFPAAQSLPYQYPPGGMYQVPTQMPYYASGQQGFAAPQVDYNAQIRKTSNNYNANSKNRNHNQTYYKGYHNSNTNPSYGSPNYNSGFNNSNRI